MSVPPPPECAWLVELIGEAATLKLLNARGGTRVQIPATDWGAKSSVLGPIIGVAAVTALSRAQPGLLLRVPAARAWRAAILLERGGRTQAEIALAVGLTEGRVERLARAGYVPCPPGRKKTRQAPPPAPQLDLPL